MRFGTKLALFLIAALIAILAATGLATYALIRNTLAEEGIASLSAASAQFTRQLGEIAAQMAAGVKVLTLDYALRQAIAQHDHATVVSALRNHGRRVGAARMLLVETDGAVSADTDAAGGLDRFAYPALLDRAVEDGRAATVVVLRTQPVWLVVVPVLAPEPIAFVATALPLDAALLDRISTLSNVPHQTGFAIRTGARWRTASGPVPPDLLAWLDTDGGLPDTPRIVRTRDGEAIFLAKPLATPAGSPAVATVMAYPLANALRPYHRLLVVLLFGVATGLAAAMAGAWRIARGVARPLEALAAQTRRIAAGDYAPLTVLRRRDEIGQLSAALGSMTQAIADRERQIRHQATHDPVTGLPNRAALAAAIDAALRNGPATIAVLGLARLQEAANTVGRDLADRVMRDAGKRLSAAAGAAPFGCIGEQSFGIMLPGNGEAHAASLLAAFDVPYREADLAIDTGAALGLAFAPVHGDNAALLLRRAEVALHAATRTPSRSAAYRADTDPHRPERLSLMSELRSGLGRGELYLLYQPKLALPARRILGAEALVRWQHPQRGAIPPGQFVGLAEETGNIQHLTEWALQTGVRQLAAWRALALPLRLSVNVSVRDLVDAGLPDRIAALLAASGLNASDLTLEVTESAIMAEPDLVATVLRRLSDRGIGLAIDDFGVGQSSLAYLRRLPVHELKIDQAFLRRLPRSTDDQTIVGSVVELGHRMGFHVTAEGVEDAAALELLEQFGCDEAQGFFVGRPMHAEALQRLALDWSAKAASRHAVPCPTG
jgi:predicted signal transduction protein with EAL and GGDEF domain